MLSLIGATFFEKYGLLIVLTVALAILMFISFNRRKREEANRSTLNDQLTPGTKVKTYGGIYGKIVNIEETTDGKIVLLETGEGKKVSYQQIHINAIFGLDNKQPVILDEAGEPILREAQAGEIDLDKLEAERLALLEEVKAEEVVSVEEEAPKKPATKKPTAKKTTAKKTTKK